MPPGPIPVRWLFSVRPAVNIDFFREKKNQIKSRGLTQISIWIISTKVVAN